MEHRGHAVSELVRQFTDTLSSARWVCLQFHMTASYTYQNRIAWPSDLSSWKLAAAGIAAARTVGLIAQTHLKNRHVNVWKKRRAVLQSIKAMGSVNDAWELQNRGRLSLWVMTGVKTAELHYHPQHFLLKTERTFCDYSISTNVYSHSHCFMDRYSGKCYYCFYTHYWLSFFLVWSLGSSKIHQSTSFDFLNSSALLLPLGSCIVFLKK